METNAEVSAVSRCTNKGVWTPPPACVQKRICSHVYCVLQVTFYFFPMQVFVSLCA
jgi:hypothetical protein